MKFYFDEIDIASTFPEFRDRARELIERLLEIAASSGDISDVSGRPDYLVRVGPGQPGGADLGNVSNGFLILVGDDVVAMTWRIADFEQSPDPILTQQDDWFAEICDSFVRFRAELDE